MSLLYPRTEVFAQSQASYAEMGPAEVWDHCRVDEGAQGLLQIAMKQPDLGARAVHRVLKLSRTIADLSGAEEVRMGHLAEALQYRPRWGSRRA